MQAIVENSGNNSGFEDSEMVSEDPSLIRTTQEDILLPIAQLFEDVATADSCNYFAAQDVQIKTTTCGFR